MNRKDEPIGGEQGADDDRVVGQPAMTLAADAQLSAPEHEALGWIDRVTSGEATDGDLAALAAWRERSAVNRRAFADAVRLRRIAAALAIGDVPAAHVLQGSPVSRRALFGGAFAAVTASYLAVRPPLGMWPSLAEMRADYRTGKGENTRLVIANARVELNTQTALASAPGGVRLIAGELAADIGPNQPFSVAAGNGDARGQGARINVSDIGGEVCVTCLGGVVRVTHDDGAMRDLRSGTLVRYTAEAIGEIERADLTRASAWRNGLLIFRDEPLAKVVAEVNRYRAGRIVLADSAAGRRTFNGVFRIDRIDDVVTQIRSVAGVGQTSLPGGVLLLS